MARPATEKGNRTVVTTPTLSLGHTVIKLNENQKDGPTSSSTASVPTSNPGYLRSELHPNKPPTVCLPDSPTTSFSFVAKLPCFTSSASGNLGLDATEPNEHKQRNTFVLRKRAIPEKPGAGTVLGLPCRTPRNQGSHLHLWPTRPLSPPHLCHPDTALSLLLGAHNGVPEMARPPVW